MGEVIYWNGPEGQQIDPNVVLERARDKCIEVLVIGFEEDGSLYFSGSTGEAGQILTLLELAKRRLLEGFCE